MAEKKSIFDFADKFGYKSPFGNWVAEDFKQIQSDISISDLQIILDKEKNLKLIEDEKIFKNLTGKEPTSTKTGITITLLTNGQCKLAKITIKNVGSKECSIRHRSSGVYEAIAKFVIDVPKSMAPKNGFNKLEYIVKAELIDDEQHIIDKWGGKINVDTYRNVVGNYVVNDATNLKNTKCFCNRDFTDDEFQNIIFELRKLKTPKGQSVNTELFNATNCKLNKEDKTLAKITRQLNIMFAKFEIDKCIHKIHFLSQSFLETDGFRTTLEYATNKEYKPYFGRGIMQLTHKSNYKIYSAFYNDDSGNFTDFLVNYDIIAQNLYHSFNTGGWFWKKGKVLSPNGNVWTPPPGAPEWVKKNNPRFPKTIINYQYKNEKGKYGTIDFNLIAEQDMVDVISYLVNGGSTGLQERRDYVQSLKKIMKYDECANK